MKRSSDTLFASLALSLLLSLTGCIAIGNRDAQHPNATLRQQLIDLQKARDTGAITDAEYQSLKTKLLESR